MKTMRIFALLCAMLTTAAVSAQTYTVNTDKTVLKWTGKKVGGSHYGNISVKSGELIVDGNVLKAGSFVIDMNTITCTDLEDEGYNAKLVGHLKSDDFFGVDKYPEAKLVLKTAANFKGGKALVKGDLTIKGKSNPVEFEVSKNGNDYMATIVVDRSKYDVRYGSNSFFDNLGDKAIDDEFTLEVSLKTARK